MRLDEIVNGINPVSKEEIEIAQVKWNEIVHPLHSLGKLEDYVIKIAGITENHNVKLPKKALVVMCGDNGVVEEGVTQTGQEVTAIVAENFLTQNCSASIMCHALGVDIFPVDIGIYRDTNIINKKIAYGTHNMTKERAMSREEVLKAINVGVDMVGELKEKGYGIIATGEMGIGNTTTSSAIASVLLSEDVEKMTGRGAGLDNEGLMRKKQAIIKAIALHHPDKDDVIDVLSCVGGFDIAGLVGVFLGGAYHKVPIVIDGFISSVSALCAYRISEIAREYMIASHGSKEPGARLVLEAVGFEPALEMNMCLGEGTGAIALLPLIDLGINVYQGMGTFKEHNIEQYEEFSC